MMKPQFTVTIETITNKEAKAIMKKAQRTKSFSFKDIVSKVSVGIVVFTLASVIGMPSANGVTIARENFTSDTSNYIQLHTVSELKEYPVIEYTNNDDKWVAQYNKEQLERKVKTTVRKVIA